MKHADHAVWGTLVEIQERGSDRLLVLSTLAPGRAGGAPPPATLRLVEPAGLLPEGTPLAPGVTGLFLYVEAADGTGIQEPVDGLFLPHGLLPGSPGPLDRMAVGSLLASLSGETPGALDDALALLEGAGRQWRLLALEWLRERAGELPAYARQRLRAAFEDEAEPVLQEKYLELFVTRALPLAEGRTGALLCQEESVELRDMALIYLVREGTDADRAGLLAAYPGASSRDRSRLLHALARLEVPLPGSFWQQALTADDPELLVTALESLGAARAPQALETYHALLGSDSEWVRGLALRGLASLATPGAITTLREHARLADPDDPTRTLARRLLRHPYRHGAQPPSWKRR